MAAATGMLPPLQDFGPACLGLTWTTLALAVIAVALRVYSRLSSKSWGVDDYAIVVALALAIFGDIVATLQVKAGWGQHLVYVPPAQLVPIVKYLTINQLRSTISVFLIKFSICFFLLRILDVTYPRVRLIIVANIVVYGIMVTVFCFAFGFQCVPFNAIWDTSLPAHCIAKSTINNIGLAGNIINVLSDFLYALLPIYIVYQLQMPKATKRVLSVILGLGILIAACSIGKAATFSVDLQDFTWSGRYVQMFATFEENLGIVVASLPALRSVVRTMSTHLSTYGSKLLRQENTDQNAASSNSIGMRNMSGRARYWQYNDDQNDLIAQDGKIPKRTNTDVESSLDSVAQHEQM